MENVLKTWPPKILPQMLEHRDERRGDQLFLLLVACFEDVQPDGIFGVGRVEVDDLVRSASRYEI